VSNLATYREDIQFSRNAECKSTLNAALGLAGESGEVCELIKKERFQGRAYDPAKMLEELGDVLWYLDCMAEVHGFTLDDVAAVNVDKLRKRYPAGFVKGGGLR
jgi:NTP pyrophosphatase (non-canonical NTP hydrolase)